MSRFAHLVVSAFMLGTVASTAAAINLGNYRFAILAAVLVFALKGIHEIATGEGDDSETRGYSLETRERDPS